VSFTNATAFSPTDTMPLTPWAKMLMMARPMASLLTSALVAVRAVDILNWFWSCPLCPARALKA